ncbi:hypothetical protein [Streptomyces sp. NRRL S-350]|uniref:hypothetical protein n=1 Tax=Streptomyces sp. NRRL S-350 TaxID=1463902 RepID=UPI0004C054CB|nr:hypothetical protein [Streptomyces sp. NRRL S-350]
MLGIHHQVSRPPVTAPPDEIGRLGWMVIGSSVLAAAAIRHGLAGAVTIAKDMTHPAPQSAPAPERPAPAAGLGIDERDGWIFITAVFVLAGAVARGLAHFVESLREATHPTHQQVRA